MDNFCGSTFWNDSLSWTSKVRPDLTYCFEETALLWAPVAVLWIGTISSVISLKAKEYRRSSYKHRKVKDLENLPPIPIAWSFVNIALILISLSFVALSIAELSFTLIIQLSQSGASHYVFPVHWAGPVSKIATFLYLIYVINLFRRNGRFSSGVIFVFYLLYLVYSAMHFQTMINAIYYHGTFYPEYNKLFFVCRTIGLILSIGQLLLSSITDQNANKKIDPHRSSSFISRITFWWFTKLVITGYRRPLVERDMWDLDRPNTSQHILRRLEQKMDVIRTEKIVESIKKHRSQSTAAAGGSSEYQWIPDRRPTITVNVSTLILRIYWKQLALVGALKLITSVLMFANPVLLDRLLTFMAEANDEPAWRGYLYASLMFLFPMVESILNNQYEYWINVVTLRVRTCLISLIYNKSLRLSTVGRRDFSTGEILNIMTVDAQRFVDFLNSANQIWSSPLQFTIAMYLLWQQVGPAALAGILFLGVLVPLNGMISKLIRDTQVKVMREKDKRTKLMNEILNGIRVLKLYAWENAFQQKVLAFREQECRYLYRVAYLFGFLFFAFSAAPLMVGILTFTTYVMTGHVLDPNKAFVSLSLFNLIRIPMGMFPMLLSMGAMCLVAITRINLYLNSKEIDEEAITRLPNNECAIQLKRTSFTWDESKESLLTNLNLDIGHGKLIAIVGSVGSGKTSLLSGILGDMEKVSGEVNVDGKLAYVPQQAWIQNATLRKNIVFATGFDEKRYRKVVKACCLEPDIAILTGGDQTEIGEKGINLSGGQKQRISLARAVYSHANIFLLDDPLSAVDANVGKKLFENVIGNTGLLRNKTRVLVTHRVAILPECDEIIVMKDGQISERGTINQLVDSKGAFAEFITEYLDDNWDSESNDLDLDDKEDPELMRSLVERVRPILERSKSRTESLFTNSNVSERPPMMATRQFSMSGSTQLRRRKTSTVVSSTEILKKNQERGQLTNVETAETGSVKWTVYLKYFRTIGQYMSSLILAGLIVSNLFQVAGSLWLSEWSNDGLDPAKANDTSLRDLRLIGYAGFGAAEVLSSLVSTLVLNIACIKVSKILHSEMLKSVLFSPTSFYDTTPLGRVLNRFTKDIDVADFSLVMNLRMVTMQFFRTIVAFTMISLEAYIILFALLPVLVFYCVIQRVYIATSRQLKRIESITRSPIYNHFGETVNGSTSIRAYGVQQRFMADSNRRVDLNNCCYYSSFVASRWLSIRLEFFGYLIVFMAAMFAVISRGELSPGLAGLAISYSLNVTGVVGMLIRNSTDLESNVVSIERLIEYSQLESEGDYRKEKQLTAYDESWPSRGEIRFESYSTRYRTKSDLVLRDITLVIEPEQKVGIVGRTGAGKSSLTLALFRIIEAVNGRIVIDGIDISQLGLYELRSRITIIPQDPVLFAGTLRINLDPFECHSDQELWRALELAHLKQFIAGLGNGLNFFVSEGGENLSVGQRQLLCLARALLRKTKILILDEATAAVDMETDDLIQSTIRKEFGNCTIVTIAHRLNTVIDYDRILVLDQGCVAEYGPPKELLAKHDSHFYSMAKDAKLV